MVIALNVYELRINVPVFAEKNMRLKQQTRGNTCGFKKILPCI